MENQRTNGIQLPNGWESVGVIGRGSSGTVYRAKRVIGRNTEWAAVKHISMPANQDDLNMIRSELGTANEDTINSYLYESLQDMLGEYFQMKSLQGNTNIVACQDIQQIPKADGIGYDVYIWMELLDSLSKRIIDGNMDRNETIRMGMDICQALSLLRSKGIVHRDIKPQNIFVNERGDYKLGDFGSARGIKGTSTIMTMKGTFSYMSPEIMQGRPANFTSDIYSLGLVMYRLMNRNRHPFIQEGDISSARGIEESNYRRLGGESLPIPVDADEELGRIILKACAFEPRNRWQTPEEMYNALAGLSEGTVIKPFPVEPPQSVAPAAPEPQPAPPKPSAKKKRWFIGAAAGIILLGAALAVFAAYNKKGPPAQDVSTVPTTDHVTTTTPIPSLTSHNHGSQIIDISTGGTHTVALKANGTVIACGNNDYGQCDVQDWTDIVSVATGACYTIGLKNDGTVTACGENYYGECDTHDWTDIISVSCGNTHTVGLKKDGTVVACGSNDSGECEVREWSDIVAISACVQHTIGLRSDGTVVACGWSDDERNNVQDWKNITDISAGASFSAGLKNDGTVITVGEYFYFDIESKYRSASFRLRSWRDIIAISAGHDHIVGLKKDGTVLAEGDNRFGQCNVETWTDIVAISAGSTQTIGLKKDGTVVACGDNYFGQCNVQDWTILTGMEDPELNEKLENATLLGIGGGNSKEIEFIYGAALAKVLNQNNNYAFWIELYDWGFDSDDYFERMQSITGYNMMGIVGSDVVYNAVNGIRGFEQTGVPNARALAGLYYKPVQIITVDPTIKTISDMKGKKICVGKDTSYIAKDVFGAYNMNVAEDVELVFRTTEAAVESLKNGETDTVILCDSVPIASVMDLITAKDVCFLSMDDEHLESLLTGCPYYSKMTIDRDVYGIGSDCQTVAVKATLVADASLSDDIAYAIVKTIFEKKDEIASAHARGVELDISSSADGIAVPFHPGAAQFYKEQGIEVKTTPKRSDIKVGVILDYDENTLETYMHIEGVRMAVNNLGFSEPEWRYWVEETAAQQTAENLVSQGCNVIISSGFNFEHPLVQAARKNPEVLFIIYDGEMANVCGLDNVVNVFPKIYESRYVSGVVAGLKLKELMDEGKITDPYVGYVERMGLPVMVSSYTAFFLGVRSVVPKAHMDVKYTNSWYDPNASSKAAQSLMNKGCVIICQGYMLDTGVPSAVQSAVESGQLHYCVGYGIDWLTVAPDAVLTSAQANMGAHYQAVLSDLLNGKPIAHDYALGYGYDGVMVSALGESCAAGTAEKVEEVIAAINAGTLHVFNTSSFTVKKKKVKSKIVYFSTEEYAGDKRETIFDGYFHESYFRSQPYFNLQIDGITEIH